MDPKYSTLESTEIYYFATKQKDYNNIPPDSKIDLVFKTVFNKTIAKNSSDQIDSVMPH